MTNEIKPVECGPEPVYLSSARVQLIANGIESGSPSAAKTLARELILSNARADALHGKRKIMPKPRPKKDWIHCPGKEQSLPEPLAHMLDELDTKL